jgi:hypothetical protein
VTQSVLLRKFAAILLIVVLVFNLGGYRFLISSLQTKADNRLEAVIDNQQYDDADLVELRVTLQMPYQDRYTDFERHYGEITIDGKAYTYVKRKIEGDVLVLKCIPNNSKQELNKTADDLVKSNSGQDRDNNGKKQTSALKVFSGDYDDKTQFCLLAESNSYSNTLAASYAASLNDVLISIPHQPPKA